MSSIAESGSSVKSRNRRGARMEAREQIERLEREIEELRLRLPKHSIPATMMIALEELEEELKALKAQVAQRAT